MAARPLAALVAGALLLAGCTSSASGGRGTAQTPATPMTTASAPSQAPVTTPQQPSTPATGSSSRPSTSSGGNAAARSTCTDVTIRVIRGSAIAGQEIAALQFTNAGPRSCELIGYPTATLFLRGKQLGKASLPSTPDLDSRRTLAPGAVAESQLHDYTACNAPLSDSVKVVVPGSTISTVRPQFQMRGCILRVDRLGPPE